jgi:hypothetical protein
VFKFSTQSSNFPCICDFTKVMYIFVYSVAVGLYCSPGCVHVYMNVYLCVCVCALRVMYVSVRDCVVCVAEQQGACGEY